MLTEKNMNTVDAIYQFDELIQRYRTVLENSCDETFLKYIHHQQRQNLKYIETANECKRLESALDSARKDISVLNSKLQSAKRILDLERMRKKRIEVVRNSYAEKLETVRRILLVEYPNLPDTVKKHLKSFEDAEAENIRNANYLSTIMESDCTFSMTNLSSTRSEDELDETNPCQNYKKHRVVDVEEPVTMKRRRPSVLSQLSTNVDIAAESSPVDFDVFNSRKHNFISRIFIKLERCVFCEKKLRCGQMAYKCSQCNAISHEECRSKVALPCVAMGTPTKKGIKSSITDLAPSEGLKIPAFLVHLINKIEQSGLNEVGLYRIPGNDKEVRNLKEKFLKCKGVPSLEATDVHTACCCLKDFLRNLDDPLIPQLERNNFTTVVADKDAESLKKLILSLPEANRHTLAYLILHLQRLASNINNKMPIYNLATVFGPTIVGYSGIEPINPIFEAETAIAIMTKLLELSSDFWNSLLVEKTCEQDYEPTTPKKPRKLLNSKNKRFFASPMCKF